MTVDDDAVVRPIDFVVAVDIHRNAATVGNVDARDATRNPAAAAGGARDRPRLDAPRGIVEDVQRFHRRAEHETYASVGGGSGRVRRRNGWQPPPPSATFRGRPARARGIRSPRASSFARVLTRRVIATRTVPTRASGAEVRRRGQPGPRRVQGQGHQEGLPVRPGRCRGAASPQVATTVGALDRRVVHLPRLSSASATATTASG